MKCYLVTGAAGFISFHLISALLKDGHRVVGIDNFDPFYSREDKDKNLNDLAAISNSSNGEFEFKKLDFSKNQDISSLDLGEVDTVVHLGAKAGVRPSIVDPQGYLQANVLGTLNVLDWCVKKGVRNFVFGSSSSVYGNGDQVPFSEEFLATKPISPYAATKRSCELFCETYSHLYNLKIASLRFFTVYGPRQRPDLAIHSFTKKILSEQEIELFGDGSTERDYTHVSDIVRGIQGSIQFVEKGDQKFHEIFNLGGNRTTSLVQLVRLIEESCGKKAKIVWKPMQPGDVNRTFANIFKSESKLGYKPMIPIDQGIKEFVQWRKSLPWS